ncbi:reverse transcriptase [Gossypium australe]|uniref:Reverse transcriptase n=1 Tax=Gossypium australe TaxID=47621 RepID=A0A5B6TI47_9ROSI|nr:reverse transcriptase [Gossypium australe]
MKKGSEQLDVKTTFLHGDLEKDIYLHQSKSFRNEGKEDHFEAISLAVVQNVRLFHVKYWFFIK